MNLSSKLVAGIAGAATLFAAAPAFAVSVVNAKRVEITSAIPDWLQIAEVEAYEFGTLLNVAASANGGVATSTGYGYGGEPSGAIDGVIPSGYVGPDVFHSDTFGAGEMLTITFASATDLASLKIFGVMDGGAPRNFFQYRIYNAGNDLLAQGQLDSRINSSDEVFFDAPAVGGIPEPSTWAVMILGFGAAGAALRSRRRLAAA